MTQPAQVHGPLVEHAAEMLATAQQAFIRTGMNPSNVEAVATLAAALIIVVAGRKE